MSDPAQGWRQRERAAWLAIVAQHMQRYPALQPDDLYKLAMQAALGAEHAVRDAQAARARLWREIETLGPGPDEPSVDPISPDGRVARVHLRPYLGTGGDPQALLEAFVTTARTHRGSIRRLRRLWSHLLAAVPGVLPFDRPSLAHCLERYAAADFPAVHHSPAYTAAYRPAYRVVDVRLLGHAAPRTGWPAMG